MFFNYDYSRFATLTTYEKSKEQYLNHWKNETVYYMYKKVDTSFISLENNTLAAEKIHDIRNFIQI